MKNLILSIKKEFLDTLRYKLVIYSFVRSTLLLRYKRSVLGFFWSLLGPVLNYLIVGIVFSLLAKSNMPNYFTYMFAGTAIFNLIAININSSPHIMITNESFIKKIYLPKSVFILNSILMEFVNFCFGITALLTIGVLTNSLDASIHYLFLPIPIIFTLMLNFGVCCLISIGSVFFRDLTHIIPIATQVLFFSTPILYPFTMLPEKLQKFVVFNPIFHFIECFRQPIYNHSLPSMTSFVVMILTAVIIFLIGVVFLKKFDNKIVFRL